MAIQLSNCRKRAIACIVSCKNPVVNVLVQQVSSFAFFCVSSWKAQRNCLVHFEEEIFFIIIIGRKELAWNWSSLFLQDLLALMHDWDFWDLAIPPCFECYLILSTHGTDVSSMYKYTGVHEFRRLNFFDVNSMLLYGLMFLERCAGGSTRGCSSFRSVFGRSVTPEPLTARPVQCRR